MTILSVDDFPDISNAQSLMTAIAIVESMAQGVEGSQRQLEETIYSQVFDFKTNIFYFTYHPIVQTFPIEVKQRGGVNELWGMYHQVEDWQTLDTDAYQTDFDLNELVVNHSAITGLNQNINNYYPRNPLINKPRSQIKVKYKAGFNFANTSNLEVVSIKSSLIALVDQMLQPANAQGVKEFQIDDAGHKTVYFSASENSQFSSKSNSQIGSILKSFHKYRPYSYAFH